MIKKLKILIAEHDKQDIELLHNELTKSGLNYESKIVDNEISYTDALKNYLPDIILSDYRFPAFNWPQIFKIREELAPEIPLIFVSGTIGEEKAVELIRNGLTDYALKDKLFTLPQKIIRAIKESEERKEKVIINEKLFKANNLYAFISQVNQNIVRVNDEATLFSNSCQLAIKFGKFKMAWIGIFENEDKEISLVEQSGMAAEDISRFINAINLPRGPQEYVINTGTYFICNDISNELELLKLKVFSAERGLNSCIVLPIKKLGKIIGTFNLYSSELRYYSSEEIDLLVEVTDDISFALDIFDRKTKQTATDEKLLKNEALFRALIEKSADIQTLSNNEGEFFYVSPSVTKVFGYAQEEFIGKRVFTFLHPEDLPDFIKKRNIIMQVPGKSFSWQYRLLHKNGTWIWCEGTLTNRLDDPAINAFVANFRNVSEKKKAEKSNQFKADLLNTINQAVIATDLTGNITYWNKAAENIYGWREDEAIGENVIDLTPSKATQEQARQIMLELAGGNSWSGEFEVKDKNGNVFPAFVTNSPIVDKEQGLVGIIGVSSNITKRKNAELKLKNSETFNRGVLNSLSSHIAVVDSLGTILAVNESWTRFARENGETNLLGTGLGANYFQVCEKAIEGGDEIASAALTGMKNVLREKTRLFNLEYPCHSLAKQRWFNMRVTKFENNESMIVVAHENISERKLAEENLILSEVRLNEAQALSHIGNWEYDFESNVHTWSNELYILFNLKKEEVKPSTALFLELLHPDDREEIKIKVEEAFKTLKATFYYFRFIEIGGTLRYGYTEQKFEFDKNNKPKRLLSVVHDITDRKFAEDEREKMIANLIQHSKNLEQFAFIVSHNLRAPVANILGLSNVLKNNISNSDKARAQEFLFTATEQLDQVFKDLSKILEVKMEINEFKEPVYFNELVSDIESSVSGTIKNEPMQIFTDFNAINKIISVKSYVHSIFYNLISNSIKYRKPDKAL
ncbi:MAG: PAS domain S-box protein, partial [Bacteroidia bacterium]